MGGGSAKAVSVETELPMLEVDGCLHLDKAACLVDCTIVPQCFVVDLFFFLTNGPARCLNFASRRCVVYSPLIVRLGGVVGAEGKVQMYGLLSSRL